MAEGQEKCLSLIGFSLICLKMVVSAKTAPEIPAIAQAYSKVSSSITVEWAAVPGATSYLLTAEDGDTVMETVVASSPGTVTGLKAATVYQITIRSISAAGRSQASTPKQAKTVLAAPVLEVSSPSPDSILVRWEAVYMATGFSVSIMRANGLGRIWKENTTNTSVTFSSLDAGTLYTIKAYAWNANGIPGDDATCNQRTSPRAPANIHVSFDSGALKASVSWNPVEGAFNYTVKARSDSSEQSCSTALRACSLSPLQCGTDYFISVFSSNDAGASESSSAVTLRTVACAPGRVTILEDIPGHLSVTWSSVDRGDYYVAFVKSDDGLEVHCNTSLTHCNFLSECGFTYFISVFAYNKAGQSPLGDVFNYTTAPCCPSDINPVLVSSDRVEMAWSPVRGAELYETKARAGSSVVECNDTVPACTLSALQCDTKYEITVYSFSEIRGSNMSCSPQLITTAPCSPEIKSISRDESSTVTVQWQAANEDARYTVTARGAQGLIRCQGSGWACALRGLPCGSVFSITAVAETPAGKSAPSYSVPLETVPCCPAGLIITQVTQSIINVSWSIATVAQTYVTVLESHTGQSTCHTHQNHCLLGCITCGSSYTLGLKAVSATGLTSECIYQSYSSSACCPLGVKVYRLGSNGIRIYWQASRGSANYSADLYGSKGVFTCAPSAGLRFCDITQIPCGDVYTVMVSPVAETGLKLTFCPKKIYSVTCSGSTLGMVIYRGKRNAE
ncbi:fibronectin type III domain-containing protein 7 [Perognathus longimembris pacificus]|uniref:fibronectin type III domain-containing protein 7 n=1 Tax=Perognathus longimembris pacificus TaxID=214514 RepID=UPI0020184B70|nr:fibronectin type III domain-containing protein 7 [Perognathus longimembris pacificus]